MKKIGICACYNTQNYGSMLQSFAMQAAIERMGYNCEYIKYVKSKKISYLLKQLPRLLNQNLIFEKMMVIKKKINLFFNKKYLNDLNDRKEAFKRFQKKYYHNFSPSYYGYSSLKENASNYDSVLVGSDQLWIPAGLGSNFYNLMFVPDEINKISYATSFGVSSIPWYQIKRTKKYLSRIDHLSVRENKGAEICKKVGQVDAKVVLDPTLLFNGNEWSEMIEEKSIVDGKYIFCYFLGDNIEHRELALELKNRTGFKIVATPFLDNFVKFDRNFADLNLFDIGPDDFINLIRNAEYVVTDSFHGSVFSILYHKKFVTLNRFKNGKNSRNSRIDSLFKNLGIEGRRDITKENIYKIIDEVIDFETVDENLNNLRIDSLKFLKCALMDGGKND